MLRLYSFLCLTIFSTVSADGIFQTEDGKTGVNFFGFHASVGAGKDGKLHADAGTPWGQYAGAGAEGGEGGGRLYAGATAGGGVSAGAGLHGGTYEGGSYGSSYAGASAGDKSVEVIKEKIIPTGGISASYKAHVVAPIETNVQIVKKHPAVVKEVTVVEQHPIPPPQPHVTTVIQKTVIPNYEKKIVKVPSYEEKVVRVPTVIEKEVWVPAPPTIIEREVPIPQPPPIETYPVVYKTKFRKRPHFLFRKQYSVGTGYGSGYAGGYANDGVVDGTYSTTITKNVNPQFYDDIFNIPISTLGAVNKLLTGITSEASGSIDVKKTFTASGAAHVH